MKNFVILVIDDNQLNLKLIEFLLSSNNYEVHCATNAEEALTLLTTLQPDLILMDIQLPVIDGLELTRKLRMDTKYKDTPIIAITAYAMDGDKEKAIEAGCNGYITKPINTRTLPNVIAKYLEKK